PARCQESPRAARVCHQRGLTAYPARLESGSQLRGRCATTDRSHASGSKLNGKSHLLFMRSLLVRSNVPRDDGQVGAECGYFAGGGSFTFTMWPPTIRSHVPFGT